jgi:hypothetical protein
MVTGINLYQQDWHGTEPPALPLHAHYVIEIAMFIVIQITIIINCHYNVTD